VVVLPGGKPVGYAQPNMSLQAVTVDTDNALKVQPVVMKTKGGDSIIWMVEETSAAPEAKQPEEKKGEEGEELGLDPVQKQEEKKAGEL
jgi:hypothetical protein